jgi:hypothetical protein
MVEYAFPPFFLEANCFFFKLRELISFFDMRRPLFPEQIMDMIGIEIAKMHKINVIHGDLTTSNMMVRRRLKEKKEDKDDLLPSTSGEQKLINHQCSPAEVVRFTTSFCNRPCSDQMTGMMTYNLPNSY